MTLDARIHQAQVMRLDPTATGAVGAVVVGLDCGLRARVSVEAVATPDGLTYRASPVGAPLHPDLDGPVREAAIRVVSAALARAGIDPDAAHARGIRTLDRAREG